MKKILTLMIISLLCLSTFSILTPHTKSEPSMIPLEVAEKAATWIISQAIPEDGGYKWEYKSSLGTTFYESNVGCGSAGFGEFFLALYKATGNSLYLDYAKGAAQWVISKAVPDSGGYKWASPDDDIPSPGWWLSPIVSGIGEFLLKMYQTTGISTYLDYATGAAQWLMAMAYWGEPGCFIPYNPPNRYGTQAAHGIGPGREAYTMTFLLHMYEETGNAVYLPYVEGTAEWLISGPDKVAEDGGYKWDHGRPYTSYYSVDGIGRIALFFYQVYQALGDAEYLEHAEGAMRWLLSQAILDDDMAKWFDPIYGCYWTLPFSDIGGYQGFWGVPEPNELLMAVYKITGDATYLGYARKLANWITSPTIATPEGGGYKFPLVEGGSVYTAYQNARVCNFLSWLYDVTGETSYSEYANGALRWIIYDAEEADGGYKWRTITYFPYYATWFQHGAAGVGYYLVSTTIIPPPRYTLTIDSMPTGVTFTVDGVSHTTPWSGTYDNGILVNLEMPEIHTVGEARYYWSQWNDGVTSRTRTLTMDTNITLTGIFAPATQPPPVGGYSVAINAYVTAEPLTPYLTLIAILTISFTTIRRKTYKTHKKQNSPPMHT